MEIWKVFGHYFFKISFYPFLTPPLLGFLLHVCCYWCCSRELWCSVYFLKSFFSVLHIGKFLLNCIQVHWFFHHFWSFIESLWQFFSLQLQVCMYVCMHALCMYVYSRYACMYACMHYVCMCVCSRYAGMYVCLYVCMYVVCTHSIWKFLVQGLNLLHSSDLSHFSDNTGSLTCCAARELLDFIFLK